MNVITKFLPLFTTGMTVETFHSQIKQAASEIRSSVSSASAGKIDTFIQKFSIGDCRAVAETIQKLTGGLVKFSVEPQRRTFTLRLSKTSQEQVQAATPEEALREARAKYGNEYEFSVS